MFKVILADDESRILKTIQTAISWNRLGLEVAGCASNGSQALALMQKTNADILITDIRMPDLDGLALCRAAREYNPAVQMILISGYADFSYAQRGIELKVLGYCLKPVNMAELTGLLKTAVKNIRRDTVLKTDDLLDYIEAGKENEIRKLLGEFGLNVPDLYLAASMNLHDIGAQLQADLSVRLGKHKYIYFSATPFDRQSAYELILTAKEKSGIGLFPGTVSPTQLQDAISECVIMSYQFFITGKPSLCERPVESPLTEDLFRRLKEAVKDISSLKTFIRQLKTSDPSLLFSVSTAYHFFYQVISCRLLEDLEADERFLSGYEQLVCDYNNFSEVLTELENRLDSSCPDQSQPEPNASSFMQIIKYLHNNYDQDISLKKLSEQFHMNSSYISSLIKNETGLTYTQYLTDLRIGKARQLLESTDLSLAEISEAVGFNDYFYFIKKFKKVVGVTPGHYTPSSQ